MSNGSLHQTQKMHDFFLPNLFIQNIRQGINSNIYAREMTKCLTVYFHSLCLTEFHLPSSKRVLHDKSYASVFVDVAVEHSPLEATACFRLLLLQQCYWVKGRKKLNWKANIHMKENAWSNDDVQFCLISQCTWRGKSSSSQWSLVASLSTKWLPWNATAMTAADNNCWSDKLPLEVKKS